MRTAATLTRLGRRLGGLCVAVSLVTACGDSQDSSQNEPPKKGREGLAPDASPGRAAPYRVVGRPLAIIEPSEPVPAFFVAVRFDRELGAKKAFFSIDGNGMNALPVRFGRRSRNCYTGAIENQGEFTRIGDPKPGSYAPFEVVIRLTGQVIRTRVRLVRPRSRTIPTSEFESLRCGENPRGLAPPDSRP